MKMEEKGWLDRRERVDEGEEKKVCALRLLLLSHFFVYPRVSYLKN